MTLLYILIFAISCFILVKSGTWLLKSLIRIARSLEWSDFFATFCLVAFATSLPELFVGISSAFHGFPQLSFGNIIGANILNLTLGLAIAALVAGGLKLKKETAQKTSLYTAFFAILPLILILDKSLSRIDGLILLAAIALYLKKVFIKKKHLARHFNDKIRKNIGQFKLFLKDLAIFFGSVALLLLSAEGVVRTINLLAIEVNLPLVAAGALFVSLGTALPELTIGIKAVSLGRKDMVLGDFMGTVVVNSCFILGIVSLIAPLKINNFSPYLIGIVFTFITALAFARFSRTDREITRKEAYALIAIYLLFVTFQFFIG